MNKAIIIITLLCAGCSMSDPIQRISPHKMDIQQGNEVTQDMLDKLKPGMTPSQVRFLLGTPLVVDPFRNDRWDYVYRLLKAGKLVRMQRVTVVFENGRLKGLEGDLLPSPSPSTQPSMEKAP